ncbi:rRNA-processing protein UTP23 homolog [Diorhabda sublineata]|uniref:rRNA-processing protein UTP23 homolog n=1 Tax=Diorhabda sublineata TaxID=1163346 RepID=UPI0024E0C35C|nr:rRNA-processing protein UTP23 homolog [Diorhabda sublineata]
MKVKRYKKVNKNLRFFINNYGFRQPYQILTDGTFCYCALNNKINIADNIPRYLHGEIKVLTTQCAIIEMENLGSKLNGALKILKQYGVHKCGHEGKPISAAKCFLKMLGNSNENHYVIATQDRDLQNKVRTIPGVPLLYLHLKTPVLEKPSDVSLNDAKKKISILCESEKRELEELKKQSHIDDKPKRRKRKGPNPLSCKKKKSKPTINNPITKKEPVEKSKRKRIKIPKHVREMLLKTNEEK